ncbi:MAG: universal stress protein, partial [Ignavibacteriae bacterium]|nr:universal stress protein [Ignavibacteriota bacterium]
MKRILLPTDFSNNSWNAIKYALQLFREQECSFILLNTYTPIIFEMEYMYSSSMQMEIVDAMKETSKRELSEILKKIKSEFNNTKHTFSQISSFNTLVLEINELHNKNAIDMIVMGTKGTSGVKR